MSYVDPEALTRIKAYVDKRRGGASIALAAAELGVCYRTALRYEQELRARTGSTRRPQGPKTPEAAHARRADYAELRHLGESREDAAARVGIAVRTTYRYDRDLGQPQGPKTPEAAHARRADYAELRQLGESREDAAARVGVTARTTYRYDRELKSKQ